MPMIPDQVMVYMLQLVQRPEADWLDMHLQRYSERARVEGNVGAKLCREEGDSFRAPFISIRSWNRKKVSSSTSAQAPHMKGAVWLWTGRSNDP